MELLTLVGALIVVVWGTIHLFPTRNVVNGFGDTSLDNKRVITMEWLFEGITLIFVGALVILVTLFGHAADASNRVVYWSAAGMLIVMAVISAQTGGKVNFIFFRLCAPLFTLAAVLIALGTLL